MNQPAVVAPLDVSATAIGGSARSRASARVAQVVLSLTPGGTERLVIDIVKQLDETLPMMVCCLDQAGEWAAELQARSIPVVTLGRRPGFHPSLGGSLARLAAAHGVRVLHCHQYSPFVYGQIASLCRRSLRVVFTEHGRASDAPPSTKRRVINPALARLPGRLFAVSHDLKRFMVAEGFPDHRVSVVHNGIEPGPQPSASARAAARQSLGLTEGELVVGTVARLDPVKDLGTLVEALCVLRREVPHVRLVIVGDGSERAELDDRLVEGNLADIAVLTGHRRDARELLPALDIYVNSSTSEGISLSILEAMAAGLPVVATSVGGTPEVVVDEVTGYLVPPRDPVALGDALGRLARSSATRDTFGARSRARVVDHFSLARMVDCYHETYRALGAC